MKKKIIIAAIITMFMIVASSFTYSNKEGKSIPTDGEEMRILYFHGHRYVCYRFYESSCRYGYGYGGASIIHDPDCPCMKSNNKR